MEKEGALVPSNNDKGIILQTEADKYGNDITAMSNFFDTYIGQLTTDVHYSNEWELIYDIPAADIGIVADVVKYASALSNGKYSLLPDFDSVPSDILSKLKKGEYSIGESKQVDGNLRPVILDENGVRIKDITLKKVKNSPETLPTIKSISNQVQMRQIAHKLDEIQEVQRYQLDRDRDRDIVTPFLNARDFILRAQEASTEDQRLDNLRTASGHLTSALNSVYTDISTTTKHLVSETKRPIFQNSKRISDYAEMIAADLQVATKFVGVQMHVLDYLGEPKSVKQVSERYTHALNDFFLEDATGKGQSAALLLHNYFPYSDSNRNSWYEMTKEITPTLKSRSLLPDNNSVYLISVEDQNGDE